MVFDSIANASIPTSASNAKDIGKKKRVNRTAKLKQCKLDVRREQWLSQVKNKGLKDESNGAGVKTPSPSRHAQIEREQAPSMMKIEINHGDGENKSLMNHYSDSESPSNSPISHASSVLESDRSVTPFTGSSSRSSSRGSSSSLGCSGSMTGSMTEEDDGENDCLDDWEALADAIAAEDNKNDNHDPNLDSPVHENAQHLDLLNAPEAEPVKTTGVGREECSAARNGRAWRPDDAFRPQSLPNLSKQNSFPINLERRFGCVGPTLGFKDSDSPSSTCPICCEELDMTDSSFLPCPCGYRLCLFCHKRILEDSGRCPGCRKLYDQPFQAEATVKLGRSYSMIPRR